MTDTYRLTFNKPAVAQMLHTDAGEQADGLKVQMDNGTVSFLPVRGNDDEDVLRLEPRSRGGVEASIEGTLAGELAEAMEHENGPFSTLERRGGGWLSPQPHPVAEAPSKFVPHVRLWDMNADRPKKEKPSKEKRAPQINIAKVFDKLHEARNIVVDFDKEKRRGQPPKSVREARETLLAFDEMVVKFMPEIGRAHSLLGKVLSGEAARN